ncbi:A24 family peptidase C-terminal domain-containing protein [Pyrococcus kukulkanii]|uniref:A24 family peptidase C-terminal domain-containing protein n=1 Tax=Pyrococcus kukulkanii TaxID=1609559 RepID=UPI003564BEDC
MLPLILGILVGIITSYTDIKTSYIYEEHFFPTVSLLSKWWCSKKGCNYEIKGPLIPIVEVGMLYYLILGVKNGSFLQAFSGVIGLFVGALLGMLLYYTGGWASGDVIILAAFSGLLPFAPSSARYPAPYSTILPLNGLTILFNSLLLIFPLLFIYALFGLVIKGNVKHLILLFREGLRTVVEVTLWIIFSIVILAFIQVNLGITINPVIRWVLTFLLLAIFAKVRSVGDVLGLGAIAYGLYLLGTSFFYPLAKLFLTLYAFKLLFSAVKLLRKEVLVDVKRVEELREGDVLGERLIKVGDKIVRDRQDFFEKLSRLLKEGKYESIEGEEIAGFSVEGLTKEQIEMLKALVSEGKLKNEFLVRKAMPFAPALFLGFLTSYFFGDILWWLILKVSGLA